MAYLVIQIPLRRHEEMGARLPQHLGCVLREKLFTTNNGYESTRKSTRLSATNACSSRPTASIDPLGANHGTTDRQRPLGCNRKDMLPPTRCLGAEIPSMRLEVCLRRSGIAMRLNITSAAGIRLPRFIRKETEESNRVATDCLRRGVRELRQ
jgi:hypothetical protein